MFRKIYHITLMLILLVATSGVSISKHYCHGELVSSNIFGKAHSCCDTGCKACDDKVTVQKVNDDFVNSVFHLEHAKDLQLFCVSTQCFIIQTLTSPDLSALKYNFQNAPPPLINSEKPEFLEVFRC